MESILITYKVIYEIIRKIFQHGMFTVKIMFTHIVNNVYKKQLVPTEFWSPGNQVLILKLELHIPK